MPPLDEKPKRTPEMILADIVTKLATIDGIATSDAFALGGLIREYGHSCAGEVASSLMESMLGDLKKSDRPERLW